MLLSALHDAECARLLKRSANNKSVNPQRTAVDSRDLSCENSRTTLVRSERSLRMIGVLISSLPFLALASMFVSFTFRDNSSRGGKWVIAVSVVALMFGIKMVGVW